MATSAAAAISTHPRRRWGWSVFSALLIAFLFVAFPVYIIRPFRTQHPAELIWALRVVRLAPVVTIVLGLVALWCIGPLWRAASVKKRVWLRRTGLALLACLSVLFAVAAQLDIYEFMFHPISAVRFVPATKAMLANDDMVMTANFNGEAHAYPVREMGYHHVVNDVVGGIPVAATY